MRFSRLCRKLSYSFFQRIKPNILKNRKLSENLYSTSIIMNQQKMQEFVLELKTPFEELDCREAFESLSGKEQKYLHYYTKVSE